MQPTGKYGDGVYARGRIAKGETIYFLHGVRLDLSEVVERLLTGDEDLDNPLQVGRRQYVVLERFCRTFNHSCDPNAGFHEDCELFALRDIDPGEQITYDYSATVAPTEWTMLCRCGAEKCRKIVGDVRSIPKAQMDLYRGVDSLQTYMVRLVRELDNGTYRIPEYERRAIARLTAKVR